MRARSIFLRQLLKLLEKASLSERELDRREFLKGTAASTAAILISGKTKAQEPEKISTKSKVAILGGGYAGLAAAYRLVQKKVPCVMFDAQDRFGGRVWTQSDFGKGLMFAELGGELIDNDQKALLNLCSELQVPTQSIVDDDKNVGPEVYYFGGKLYNADTLIKAFKPFGAIIKKDQRKIGDKPPDHKDFQYFDKMPMSDYFASKKGQVEQWVLDLFELAYVTEYGADSHDQSAVNFLMMVKPTGNPQICLYGDSDESLRIKGGNQRLADALVAFLQNDLDIRAGHALTKVSKSSAGALELTFKKGATTLTESFDKIVCAIPFSTLRNVEGIDSLGLSAQKLRAIKEIGYGTNRKFTFETKARIWREKRPDFKTFNGSIFTDLPSQSFWESSRAQSSKYGLITNFRGGSQGLNFKATEADKNQVYSELEKIIPGIKSNVTGDSVSFPWPDFMWAHGSYTCPKPGQYSEVLPMIAEPELNRRIFFAGEHISVDYQGFMNGAIETGETAARDLISSL